MITTFIAPSVFVRERLRDWGIAGDHVKLVRNFVPRVPAPSLALGRFGIYVGRLSAEKGVHVLLRALSTAGDPPFVIIGDGPLRPDLIAAARSLRLRHTEFAGRLPARQVSQKLSSSRFLVMPSLCEENAPLAVMEAMAHGRPVLVSRRGGLSELVDEGGGLMSDAGDERKLAMNIAALGANDDMCRALSRAALHTARKHFTPEAHLSRLEKVYRSGNIGRDGIAPDPSKQR
jgi:glycosyltransferase involved in cell wall biosynthesis